MKKWLVYEKMVDRIYETISPKAKITHDDHILGKNSKTRRQIDVSIRFKEAGIEFLVIVQAKNWITVADVNVVGEFKAVMEDVKATSGVLICKSGFTKAAKEMAINSGISLFSAHDAEEEDWKTVITIPFIWKQVTPNIYVSFKFHLDEGDKIPTDIKFYAFSTNEGKNIKSLMSSFIESWNSNSIPKDAKKMCSYQFMKKNLQLNVGRNKWADVNDFTCNYEIVEKYYRKDVTTTEFTGLKNLITGDIEISKLTIQTPTMDINNGWTIIENPKNKLQEYGKIIGILHFPVYTCRFSNN